MRYPILKLGVQRGDATDGPRHANVDIYTNVVKYKIMPSKNPQDKDETDYFLKVGSKQSLWLCTEVHVWLICLIALVSLPPPATFNNDSLQIEVDAPQFKYIIAHVCVTAEHLSILHQTWTTST